MAGTTYHIAVDGLTGATGDIVLSWNLNLLENLLPVLSVLPTTKVGLPGDNSVSISVAVQGLVTYQWYLNCQPIPGAVSGRVAHSCSRAAPHRAPYAIRSGTRTSVEPHPNADHEQAAWATHWPHQTRA